MIKINPRNHLEWFIRGKMDNLSFKFQKDVSLMRLQSITLFLKFF